jgi:uncharacterized protein with NRDE domain
MCIALLAFHAAPQQALVLAHNRDEYFNRVASPAKFWSDHPDVLAGRDEQSDGTWLGITRSGRVALITNYRKRPLIKGRASRGELARCFLTTNVSAQTFVHDLIPHSADYSPFNMIVGTIDELYFFSSEAHSPTQIPFGYHGLSNGPLNAQWPKVTRGMAAFKTAVDEHAQSKDTHNLVAPLFSLLTDDTIASDSELPHTGVSPDYERALSPVFVRIDGYGTRASTVIIVTRNGEATFIERTYDCQQTSVREVAYTFPIQR